MNVRTRTCAASISAVTHGRLGAFPRQQAESWNAAIEERIDCYRKTGFPRLKGRNRGIRSFDIPDPVIRDGLLLLKGIGRFRLPSVTDG